MKENVLKRKPLKEAMIKILVSGILVTILLFNIDRSELVKSLQLLNLTYVPLIVLFLILNYVISSIRWKNLLSIYKNSERATIWYLTNLYFIGSFFNNFMPTSIGGDVYKVFKLGKKIEGNANAFSATFMERFTGVIALIFISIVAFIVTFFKGFSGFENEFMFLGLVTVGVLSAFATGGYTGFILLCILKKKIKKLEKVYDSLILYKNENKILFVAFSTSFIVQFLAIFTQYLIFGALNVNLDIFRALFIFPIITLASFFIPSLNGIGVQDFLYQFSNAFLFISQPLAVAASILYHLFRLLVSLIGGILYAMGKAE